MFVDQNDIIEIAIYYKKEGKHFRVIGAKEYESITAPLERNDYKVVNLKMRAMTWGLYNELQDAAYPRDINGEKSYSFRAYKQNKLKTLIISWDAKRTNAKGEQENVPLNESSILNLAPEIAESILAVYRNEAEVVPEM